MNTRNQNLFWSPFSELFNDWAWSPYKSIEESRLSPACEIEESEEHYLLSLEVPGIKKEDLKIEFVDNQLVISGERHSEEKKRKDHFYYSERRGGKFSRSFKLPVGVDAEKVEAQYQDGVLKIYVPKAESAKPRQIKILGGSSSSKFFGNLIGSHSDRAVS